MAPDRREVELNELRWWSNWAKLRWHGDGYLISSEELRESFFNRAGSLTCQGLAETAAWAERHFFRRGMGSTFLAFESCKTADSLLAAGYRPVDTMTVLLSKSPIGDDGLQKVTASTEARAWTAAYLRSFYGSDELAGVVGPIVSSLLRSRNVTLLEARVRGGTAGVLALFRTPGIAGAYCVGTVPEHRRRGIATALLAKARQIADSEGRILVLQTLTSEGGPEFYLGRGFEKMNAKRVLEKSSNAD
jgi:GNAT superfamily N-acetyltransferase